MSLFNSIKSQVSILTVVGEYATLKKAGIYWKAPCPFHSERTPSFTVSPHKEIFYCFGCHEGGDVIAFIARAEHCSPLQAAKHLIDRYQLTVPEDCALPAAATNKKQYFDICRLMTEWCHDQLLRSAPALEYLHARRITLATIKKYQIGYFPGGLGSVKNLLTFMQKNKVLVDDLIQFHLLSRGKQVLFSSFEERIMFPIADHLGRLCGFGARIFQPNDARSKYYNSHENEFFAKGHLLFGLHLAKKEMQVQQKVLLVEGYTDCLLVAQAGNVNVVATLGTSCTPEHLKVLARYVQQVYVLYDGDKAGLQAILRIAELCWQVDLELLVVPLPAQEDPASYIAKGGTLITIIEKAQDIFSFYIAILGGDFKNKNLSDKMAAARRIIELIGRINDPLKRELLLQQASQVIGLGIDSLKKEVEQMGKSSEMTRPISDTNAPPKLPLLELEGGGMLEKKIFYGIMNNIALLTDKNHDFLCSYLPKQYQRILEVLWKEKVSNSLLAFNHFFEALDSASQQVVSQVVLEYQETISPEAFDQLVVQLQKKHWKVLVNAIKLKLEQARLSHNEQEVKELIEYFIELKKKVLD